MNKLALALWLIPGLLLADDEKSELKALDDVLLSDALWETPLEEIRKTYEPEESEGEDDDEDELPRELIIRLRESGFDIESIKETGALQWLSAAKKGLRSPGGFFTLLEKEVGEVVIRADEDTPSEVSISIFNRGDDGTWSKSKFLEELRAWKDALDDELGVRPESRDKAGAVDVTGWMWRKGDSAYLLEGSLTKRVNRAEFIRLRLAPLNASGQRTKATVARRGTLAGSVRKSENGDVMIAGVPMVDQGDKGYCVVATVERVGRYLGLDVDQHELAQLANTDRYGTAGADMEEAFKALTGKIHVRTLRLLNYDQRQFERDYDSYNRAAKKEGVRVFEEDLDEWIIDPRYFWSRADKEVFKAVKGEQNKFGFFVGKIEEYIDQGIPVCWTLYMGMFPEKDTPQSFGGHMRLIIGYNKDTKEIIYSDSWGDGHAVKRMPAVEAWCMSMGIYVMLPNR